MLLLKGNIGSSQLGFYKNHIYIYIYKYIYVYIYKREIKFPETRIVSFLN